MLKEVGSSEGLEALQARVSAVIEYNCFLYVVLSFGVLEVIHVHVVMRWDRISM